MERTFVMIKPDGIKRRLISRIIQKFEEKGLYLAASKCVIPKRDILEQHYSHLSSKPFFNEMVESMMSEMVLAMVWVGKNAVSTGRKLIGETDPQAASVGTIRGDYGITVGKNIIHGSDTVENAEREIKLWIGDDVQPISFFDEAWIY